MTANQAYEELVRRSREITVLGSCASVLGWEQETYMPPGGIENRGNQLSLLAGLRHEKATDPRFGELLAAVEGSDLVGDPVSVAAVNVRELRRNFDRATKLPKELVEELAKTTAVAQSFAGDEKAECVPRLGCIFLLLGDRRGRDQVDHKLLLFSFESHVLVLGIGGRGRLEPDVAEIDDQRDRREVEVPAAPAVDAGGGIPDEAAGLRARAVAIDVGLRAHTLQAARAGNTC